MNKIKKLNRATTISKKEQAKLTGGSGSGGNCRTVRDCLSINPSLNWICFRDPNSPNPRGECIVS